MRKGLISVLAVAAGFLGATDTARATQCPLLASLPCNFPNLVSTIGATVSPRSLPANEYAQARWNVFGNVATRDGTHPSALRQVDLDIDKDVKINVEGYPICGGRLLATSSTKAVRKVCGDAILGGGEAHVEVASTEEAPVVLPSSLLVFNGGEVEGEVRLLIRAFASGPAPTAIITRVRIQRRMTSGLQMSWRVPPIADGMGSLLDFKFKLGKTYSYKGKKVGYFEAKCPDGVFKANVSKLLFRNEARVPGVAAQTVMKGGFAVPCTPKG